MSDSPREQWSTRIGFLLAAVGSAVGLGNMWRFSYITAEQGGAAFVLLYVLMTVLVGLPVMLAELTVGRGARRSPIQALAHFGGPSWRHLGLVFVAAGFVILAYYSVIAGWTLRYAVEALAGGFDGDSAARFEAIATGGPAVAWHLGFMTLTALVVSGGVRTGIERAAVVLMPLLFALVIGLSLYASTLDGATGGYAYYLTTDFGKLASFDVLRAAAGQAFFSLSLGMGAILTYASYLPSDDHLPRESLLIAGSDFAVAFVSGLMVFPLIFALGLSHTVIGTAGTDAEVKSVGALFITLPTAFAKMGAAGKLFGFAFFAALVVGALTSAISLLEVVVASAIDGLGWERKRTTWVAAAAIALLGIPAALGLELLSLMDQVAGNVLLVAGGLLLALFVGFRMEDPIAEARKGAEGVRWFFWWRALLRFAVPVVLAVVLFSALVDTWAQLTG